MSAPAPERARLDTADDVAATVRRWVTAGFTTENTRRQEHRDPTALSMSGLGGCTRQAAYSIAGTPPSDVAEPEDARQAMLGAWIHDHLLPLMAEQAGPGALIEQPVTLSAAGLVIPGTLDFTRYNLIIEGKTVKEWRLHGVRRGGVFYAHRLQNLGYALGHYQAGNPLRWLSWLYLDRATGEVHLEVEEFTNAAALTVIARVEEIRYWSAHPDQAPRREAAPAGAERYATMRGPGKSFGCDRCPWLKRCWGDDAVPGQPGAQRTLAQTIAGVEEALGLYAAAAAVDGPAKADKEFVKLVVADIPDGTYGKWMLKRGQAGWMDDMDAIRAHYDGLGLELPQKRKAGAISVKPVPQSTA